jgi:hypothetical protein
MVVRSDGERVRLYSRQASIGRRWPRSGLALVDTIMLNKIMAKSTNIVKRKAGRPATLGATEFVGLRLPAALLNRIKDWARGEKIVGRSEAVRALLDRAILILLPRRHRPPAGDYEKAIEYGQRLLDASINVVGASNIQLNELWARDPKVVGLAILCRSICNFRGAMRLLQQEQPVEARVLVRLMHENLLWLGALRERGIAFVNEMIADEQHNRKALMEVTLKLTGKHGRNADAPDALQLRSFIRQVTEHFPTAKKLRADKIAAQGVLELSYIEYARLSLDAVHCSVTALGRHLSSIRTDTKTELTVSVIPNMPAGEVMQTVLRACQALMGASIAVNELLGFTSANDALSALDREFDQNWLQKISGPAAGCAS